MHFVDAGPADGPVFLLLHGEPTWSYLYRKMIPPLVAAGFRCVAPDLIGFGRSDKPAAVSDYTYDRHLQWLGSGLDAIGVGQINLFCQDWGGLLGLRLVAAQPKRFDSVCAANTILPTGEHPPSEGFLKWRAYSQSVERLDAGRIVAGGCARPVADEAVEGYRAPYPDETYNAGARAFPLLVPIEPGAAEASENRHAWKVLDRFERPFLTLFADSDPVMSGAERVFLNRVPGCAGQPHAIIENAGHFIQEDAGEELAERLVAWLK